MQTCFSVTCDSSTSDSFDVEQSVFGQLISQTFADLPETMGFVTLKNIRNNPGRFELFFTCNEFTEYYLPRLTYESRDIGFGLSDVTDFPDGANVRGGLSEFKRRLLKGELQPQGTSIGC